MTHCFMADLLRQSVAKCWNVETELCKCLFCGCNSPCFIVVVLSVGRQANMWSWTAEVPGLPSGSSVLKSSHVTVLVWTYQSVMCFPPALSWLHMYNNACLWPEIHSLQHRPKKLKRKLTANPLHMDMPLEHLSLCRGEKLHRTVTSSELWRSQQADTVTSRPGRSADSPTASPAVKTVQTAAGLGWDRRSFMVMYCSYLQSSQTESWSFSPTIRQEKTHGETRQLTLIHTNDRKKSYSAIGWKFRMQLKWTLPFAGTFLNAQVQLFSVSVLVA